MKPSHSLLLICYGFLEATKSNAFRGNNNLAGQIWVPRNNLQIRTRTITYLDREKGNNDDVTSISTTRSKRGMLNDRLQGDKLIGFLVLLSVPITWGTYAPVVRFLYKIEPPVPGFVFSACYYTLAAITTSILALKFPPISTSSSELDEQAKTLSNDTSKKSSPLFNGGIELGLYLFVANCLQVIGLRTVESDRAGFLVQLTTVMVPVCEGIFAGNLRLIPVRTWIACTVAFSGLCVMNLDGKGDTLTWDNPGEMISTISQGDFLILTAAVLYTLHVVRLGKYAPFTTPMKLAASKATTESILSVFLIVFLISLSSLQDRYQVFGVIENDGFLSFSVNTGREITSFFSSFTAGISDNSLSKSVLFPAFGSILWTGWVTCAYTIWAQSFGQQKISPTNANLIYTFQPIFTAFFAWIFLGETMGTYGFVGGAIIVTAVYLVASNNEND